MREFLDSTTIIAVAASKYGEQKLIEEAQEKSPVPFIE